MVKVLELQKTNSHIYTKLYDTFNNKFFPCLYGKMSFSKNFMYVGLYQNTEAYSIQLLAEDLRSMSLHLDNQTTAEEMQLNTFIAVFDMDVSKIKFDNFWFTVINSLHKKDFKNWKIGATKDLNDPEFKFSFDNKLWYPVLVMPNHPNKIRKSKIIILSFQPDQTFLLNKSIDMEFYENTRKRIHKRINKLYQADLPHYLSGESTGKGIVQFLGYDFQRNKNYEYPSLFG